MGLISFAKSAGRKFGFFGGQEAAQAEAAGAAAATAAAKAAADAAAKATAAAAAADAAEKAAANARALEADVRAAILGHGVTVESLTVAFANDVIRLGGTAPSQLDRERAVLIAGNTQGVAGVEDDLEVVVPEPPAVYHTVQKGDSLSKVALDTYGNMRLYPVIFEANKPMLTDPDLIYPGQVLRIPASVDPMVHTVAKGDTLGAIAKHYYGQAGRYNEIFEANRNVLSSADAVEIGQQLTIPHRTPSAAVA